MRKIKIKIDVYDISLTVLYGGIEKEFIKWAEKNGFGKIDEGGCEGFYGERAEKNGKVKERLLWVCSEKDKNKLRGYIVHEVFHAITAIMSYKNIHLVETEKGAYHHSTDEAYAYLMEFLYNKITNFIEKDA